MHLDTPAKRRAYPQQKVTLPYFVLGGTGS